jgi:hypothetical protein
MKERIMPAIWFGTVVRWTLVAQAAGAERRGKYKPIKHADSKHVRTYVPDDIESEEARPKIVAKYIDGEPAANKQELWEAYGKGLLQVFDIDKTIVSPPRIPWDDQ